MKKALLKQGFFCFWPLAVAARIIARDTSRDTENLPTVEPDPDEPFTPE
jgi:hypothetical protein